MAASDDPAPSWTAARSSSSSRYPPRLPGERPLASEKYSWMVTHGHVTKAKPKAKWRPQAKSEPRPSRSGYGSRMKRKVGREKDRASQSGSSNSQQLNFEKDKEPSDWRQNSESAWQSEQWQSQWHGDWQSEWESEWQGEWQSWSWEAESSFGQQLLECQHADSKSEDVQSSSQGDWQGPWGIDDP